MDRHRDGELELAVAMLDRVTHRAEILEMNGESYRLRSAKKEGPRQEEVINHAQGGSVFVCRPRPAGQEESDTPAEDDSRCHRSC